MKSGELSPANSFGLLYGPLSGTRREIMEYLIGIGLAALVCVFATLVGFDRDRVFYPAMAIVVATYYILFAVIGRSTRVLAFESLVAAVFFALAVAGFKKNLWLAVASLI